MPYKTLSMITHNDGISEVLAIREAHASDPDRHPGGGGNDEILVRVSGLGREVSP